MKINLAVLFGGKSVEHEISVISAIQAINNLNTDKYNIFPIYITKNNEFFYGEVLKNIDEFRNIPELIKKCEQVSFISNNNRVELISFNKVFFSKKHITNIYIICFL